MADTNYTPESLFIAFQSALIGRYSIDRELGRGGMGVVYLAREVHLDRMVAIKLLPPHLAERGALRDRFVREAQLAAKLSHPNIVPIHAVAEADGFVYYVMAYVDGETLAQRVQTRGPLSATDGTRMLREVAWALGYAHSQGLVHRDVKPDNILIEASSGRAIVVDFGIAAAHGDAESEGVTGTPEFMSPEQALGGTIDARSDLYSLGATAFYALSGRLVFEGKTATEVLGRHVSMNAPSLATMSTAVPRKLAQLIDRCLSKEPAHRPPSAQTLADQLGLAIEQRRELPAALRAFIKRSGRMDGGGTILSLGGALVASIAVSSFTSIGTGLLTLGASIAAIPVVFGIAAAKHLLDLGFTRADLAPAFRAELASSREERSIHQRSGFSFRAAVERILSKIARTTGAAAAVVAPFAVAGYGTPRYGSVGSVVIVFSFIAALSGFGFLVMMQLRRDVDIEFWSAMWTGRFGAFAFSIAKGMRGAKPVGAAMTHRATELSLGMAAEQLFESLPKASRETLGDVPGMLQRLQRDAHALRTRFNAIQDALTQAGSAAQDDHYAVLREECDCVKERMRETVGALENVRLGLLRLHAGSLSLEGLTTHVGIAAGVSADVERLIAAQAQVEELLRYPQSIELTPV